MNGKCASLFGVYCKAREIVRTGMKLPSEQWYHWSSANIQIVCMLPFQKLCGGGHFYFFLGLDGRNEISRSRCRQIAKFPIPSEVLRSNWSRDFNLYHSPAIATEFKNVDFMPKYIYRVPTEVYTSYQSSSFILTLKHTSETDVQR